MDEKAVRGAITSAIREAVRMGAEAKSHTDRERARLQATEYAEQLILPTITASIEQAREEGYQDCRAQVAA